MLGQHSQQRTEETPLHLTQTVEIAHAVPAGPQRGAAVREQQPPIADQGVSTQPSEQPAHTQLAQMRNAPPALSRATPLGAEQDDAPQAQTPQPTVLEMQDDLASLSSSTDLAHASGLSMDAPTAERSVGEPASVSAARQPALPAQSVAQDAPAAPTPGSPEAWLATLQKMRALRVQIEQDLEMDTRVFQARQARMVRGEQPYTELELRDGYDPDSPSALRKIASGPQDAVSRRDAPSAVAHTGNAQADDQQPRRRNVSKNQDVNDLIYAIDSKNDVAIDEALMRIANSASTHALIQRGREHLEAKAMQEAQEQVGARQALAMETPAEVQTSRGPVMVMTLPQFAHGPMMQSGPQGDGGGGDGGGGGGGGGGAGGGG